MFESWWGHHKDNMFVDKAFDNSFVIDICDDTGLFKNENFVSDIDSLFDVIKTIYQRQPNLDRTRAGHALSSVVLNDTHLLERPRMKPLIEWVKSRILLAGKHLPTTGTDLKFVKAWANRMFDGYEIRCHIHDLKLDGVAIFYSDVPPGSADLVFIKDGEDGAVCPDYADADRKHVSPIEGMLVIHPTGMPHAVSKHIGNNSRTCFIFEFVYTDDN